MHIFLSKLALVLFLAVFDWFQRLMHINYIVENFASNQRTRRQVKTCEDELRP